jgi:hypothetical protein
MELHNEYYSRNCNNLMDSWKISELITFCKELGISLTDYDFKNNNKYNLCDKIEEALEKLLIENFHKASENKLQLQKQNEKILELENDALQIITHKISLLELQEKKDIRESLKKKKINIKQFMKKLQRY